MGRRRQEEIASLPGPQNIERPPPNQALPATPTVLPPDVDTSQKPPPKAKSKKVTKGKTKENSEPSAQQTEPPKLTKAQRRAQQAQASVVAAEGTVSHTQAKQLDREKAQMASEIARLKDLLRQKLAEERDDIEDGGGNGEDIETIPRPSGEAGSRDYCLQEAMGLSETSLNRSLYSRIQKCVRKHAGKLDIDVDKTWHQQDKEKIRMLKKLVAKDIPYMNNHRFPDLWPIDVMVMNWAKGQRKEAKKKQKADENGGVYVPNKRQDPAVTARAVANRKKKPAVLDDDSEEEDSGEEDGEVELEQRGGSAAPADGRPDEPPKLTARKEQNSLGAGHAAATSKLVQDVSPQRKRKSPPSMHRDTPEPAPVAKRHKKDSSQHSEMSNVVHTSNSNKTLATGNTIPSTQNWSSAPAQAARTSRANSIPNTGHAVKTGRPFDDSRFEHDEHSNRRPERIYSSSTDRPAIPSHANHNQTKDGRRPLIMYEVKALPERSAHTFTQGSSQRTEYGPGPARRTTTQFQNVPAFMIPSNSQAHRRQSHQQMSREEMEEIEDDPMADWDDDEEADGGTGQETQLHNPRITRNGYPYRRVQSSEEEYSEDDEQVNGGMASNGARLPGDFYD